MTRYSPDALLPAVPPPREVLEGINWASLYTVSGRGAAHLPAKLARLLDPDPDKRGVGLEALTAVTHQNSIYEATVPVALYVAAILDGPRLDAPAPPGLWYPGEPTSWSLRVVLLEWLGAHAYDADDLSEAKARRYGCADPGPEVIAFLELRPVLFAAIRPFLDHPDPDVRHAAVLAAAPLVAHPDLAGQRDRLALRAQRLVAERASRYHRNRAFETLRVWGHDAGALVTPEDLAAFEGYAHFEELLRRPVVYTPYPPF